MLIPGSQARLWVGPSAYSTGFNRSQLKLFRFRRANIRPRVPRIDGTNSEGLPGAVRGDNWSPSTDPISPLGTGLEFGGNQSVSYYSFKNYPWETQLFGVGVCDIEIEQTTFDYSQIPFDFPPTLNARGEIVCMWPGRYVSFVILPNWFQAGARFAYTFPHVYIEEVPHRIDIKDNQPLTVTGYTSGPWTYPSRAAFSAPRFPYPIHPVNGVTPVV